MSQNTNEPFEFPMMIQESLSAQAAYHNESATIGFGTCDGGIGNSSWQTPSRIGGFQNFEFAPKHNNWRTSTPCRPEFLADSFNNQIRLFDFDGTFNFSNSNSFGSKSYIRSTLPAWAADKEGNVAPTVTLKDVITNEALFEFASDKNGCRFLQEHYPADRNDDHRQIFAKIVEKEEKFLAMCQNMFGNFFVQRIIECSTLEEQEMMLEHLKVDMFNLSFDKSACRVIQLTIQKFDMHLASKLAHELQDTNLVFLCIDQNGNHVIQKIIKTLPVTAWKFIVDYFQNSENLISACQDKYGCRVIQSTIEKLSENPKGVDYKTRVQLLHSLMVGIVRNSPHLISNEFANYVIQYVIKTGGLMESYRDTIIRKRLLCNLLSMSQEKYASHVVEVALLYAPNHLMLEMMEEIFDGYFPHPDTRKDAIDILLFHQYGNYIIQQMINVCNSIVFGQHFDELNEVDKNKYKSWLNRIKDRVGKNSSRLERFSSGKKIIAALNNRSANFL